jgi:hypothetical protein
MSGHVEEFVNEPNSAGIWLSMGLTTIVLITIVYFGSLYYRASASTALDRREEMGGIGSDLAALHAYENEMATTLKWIDKDKGIVQIPIDVAMDLVVKSYQK